MKIWIFSSVEAAQQEDERITLSMGLSAPYNAFNYYEDEVNGVYAFADDEIGGYLNKDLIIEKELIITDLNTL